MSPRPPPAKSEASNAFLPVDGPSVRHAERGVLRDMRLAIKDVFDVAGYPTGGGSPVFALEPARSTAPSIARLLDAGAHFVGKTCLDELAFSLVGTNMHFPRPRNWAAPMRFTGGSSCGSAAAVGANEADIAIGTDTGGSVRGPASFCGLIGMRGTHGHITARGCVPLAPSFDTVGWFATSFEVYRRVEEVLHCTSDRRCANGAANGTGDKGHAARWRPLSCAALDALLPGEAEAREYADRREAVLDTIGGLVGELDLGLDVDDLYWCFRRLQAIEAWEMHGTFVQRNGAGMNADVRTRFEWSRNVTPEAFGQALRLRSAFTAWLADELDGDGVLVLPTMPSCAPTLDAGETELLDYRERALHLLCIAGLTGCPQLTLPLGEVNGAPFGISLIAAHGRDLDLLRLGELVMERAGAAQSIAPRS